jgi:hypothetical protein
MLRQSFLRKKALQPHFILKALAQAELIKTYYLTTQRKQKTNNQG